MGLSVYYIMSLLVFLSMIVVMVFFRKTEQAASYHQSLSQIIKDSFSELKHSKLLGLIILSCGFVQMFIQLHFQLWQSFFIQLGIDSSYFLYAYLVFQGIVALVYRLPVISIMRFRKLLLIILFFSVALLFKGGDLIITLISYCMLIIITFLLNYRLDVYYSQSIRINNISALVSLKSTIIRCFGVVSLLLSGLISDYLELRVVVIIYALLFLSLPLLILSVLDKKNSSQF